MASYTTELNGLYPAERTAAGMRFCGSEAWTEGERAPSEARAEIVMAGASVGGSRRTPGGGKGTDCEEEFR